MVRHNWSKICQNCEFRPLDLEYPIWYLNIVPGDFITTYGHIWSIDMSPYDLNWLEVYGDLQGKKLVKNMPQMPILSPPESRISNMIPQICAKTSSITIYGHIVIKTDMPACVLTCFRVYGGLQDQRFVKNKPKIADFAPKSLKSNLAHLYCTETYPNGYHWQKWWRLVCQYVFWSV